MKKCYFLIKLQIVLQYHVVFENITLILNTVN